MRVLSRMEGMAVVVVMADRREFYANYVQVSGLIS